MKSNSTLQLSKAWWKKEAPDGLDKAGTAFENAIDKYTKANGGLRNPDQRSIAAMQDAIAGLEDAGKKVVVKAKELEKKAKGKKEVLKDLGNTITVMEKVLARELDSIRSDLEDMEDELEEDGGGGHFADGDAHAAFLKKFANKLKRNTYSFALVLQNNEPADMRMNFHKKKGGRSLAGQIRKVVPVKKFTFGIAGTEALTTALGMEPMGARTLVLQVDGKMIPSLAKRTKLMLKKLGISAFGRVVVVKDGAVLENADEEDEDESLEDIDLTEEAELDELMSEEPETTGTTSEETGTTETPTEPTEPTETPEPEEPAIDPAALVARLKGVMNTVGKLADTPPQGTLKVKLGEAAKKVRGLIEGRRLDDAAKLLTAIEKQLGGLGLAAASAAETGPDRPREIPVDTVALNKARVLWSKTREKLNAEMDKLTASIIDECSVDEELDPIAEEAKDLRAYLKDFDDRLEKVLEQMTVTGDGTTREKLKEQASNIIDGYTTLLSESFFQDVDSNNGFEKISLTASATAALQAIQETLKKAAEPAVVS